MNKHFNVFRQADHQYFIRLKKPIFFCVVIFALSILAGAFLSKSMPEFSENILQSLGELSQKTKELNDFQLLSVIFLNNAVKVFFVLILGIFFGLVPWIFLLVNGYVIGLLSLATQQSIGLNVFLLGVLPHGVFEVPALILGSSTGLLLGEAFYKKIFLRKRNSLRREFSDALIFFLRITLPLLLVAAFVEVFVTKPLLG
jgi:stage II sporulation protein M